MRETTKDVQRLTYSVYAEEIYGGVVLYISNMNESTCRVSKELVSSAEEEQMIWQRLRGNDRYQRYCHRQPKRGHKRWPQRGGEKDCARHVRRLGNRPTERERQRDKNVSRADMEICQNVRADIRQDVKL